MNAGPTSYTGSLDEEKVSDLVRQFGELVTDAGDLGFILTYHAARGDKVGVMDLAGRGIDQALLGVLLADALEHNATHGDTT